MSQRGHVQHQLSDGSVRYLRAAAVVAVMRRMFAYPPTWSLSGSALFNKNASKAERKAINVIHSRGFCSITSNRAKVGRVRPEPNQKKNWEKFFDGWDTKKAFDGNHSNAPARLHADA